MRTTFWLLACAVSLPASLTAEAQGLNRVQRHIETWQSMRNEFRAILEPLRRPEFELRLLARSDAAGGKSTAEHFELDHLPSRIVLVIGGLQNSVQSSERFAQALEHSLQAPDDTRMGIFDYPNDGSMREAGDVLRQILVAIHQHSPKTHISIVSHSMGGLVARYAIERLSHEHLLIDAIPVDQLIMICPPNQGSVLAKYADALELADVVTKLENGSESFVTLLGSLIDDGLGEACDELVPHSPFLRELNTLDRAQGVRYGIIAGTRGPISPVVRLASSVVLTKGRQQIEGRERAIVKESVERIEELLDSNELVKGLGDGAVSLESARLMGVSEFIKLPIHHAEWSETELPQVQELIRQVAGMLSRK